MKVPVSWLREFADPPADVAGVAARLASCGFEVAGIESGVIDLEITANRPDCLSVYGMAREAATAFDIELVGSTGSAGSTGSGSSAPIVPVSIESEACGRYALAVADVTVGPSPAWLADRLMAAGVRPINNIVDVTNYVMIEMGHPMHAFDVARLAGPAIHVRAARAGERLTTLDGETRTLQPAMLVIADRERAVAVAGVMGGRASEVSNATTRIALESAWFQPASVRATSKRLGLKTEASARFERGADIDAPVRAIASALDLLAKLGAGRAAGPLVDVYPKPAAPRSIHLSLAHVARLLGATGEARIPDADIQRILTKLGFSLTPAPGGWQVGVPTFRVDVSREADLIEEIGRHWGFDRIPGTLPPLQSAPPVPVPGVLRGRRLRSLLAGAGLHEAVTLTFIERAIGEACLQDPGALVAIANPLSEKFAVMRPSLLPGLLDAIVHNRRREADAARLFEVGSVFHTTGERQHVGWAMTGPRFEHWSGSGEPVDFFDAKGVAELVAEAFRAAMVARPADDLPWFVAGRSARLFLKAASGDEPGVEVGWVGQIRADLVASRGLHEGDVFAGELDPSLLERHGEPVTIAPLPRHPSVVRDLSILVDERLPAEQVRVTIQRNAPATLVGAREFDRYRGKSVPSGQVSLSIRLTFRDADRTLTDAEVQQAVDAIVAALAREHGAVLRGK